MFLLIFDDNTLAIADEITDDISNAHEEGYLTIVNMIHGTAYFKDEWVKIRRV